jgi:hypothetical protein
MLVAYDSSKVGNYPVGIRVFGCEACGCRHSQIVGRTNDYALSAAWSALVAAIGRIFTRASARPAASDAKPVRKPGVAW